MNLEETVRDLQVQVIALRLAITTLLPDASPRAKIELAALIHGAPEVALAFEFSDLQIEQLRQQLVQMHSSSLYQAPDGDDAKTQ